MGVPDTLAERVRARASGSRVDRLRMPFTKRGTKETRTLREGEVWVLERKADDVAWDVADQPIGHLVINGAFAETSTGKVRYWPRPFRDTNVVQLGQPPWTFPKYDPDNPPADDVE